MQKFNNSLNNFGAFENLVMTQAMRNQKLPLLQLLSYGYGTAYRNESIFAVVNDQNRYFYPCGLVLRGEMIQPEIVPVLEQSLQTTRDFRFQLHFFDVICEDIRDGIVRAKVERHVTTVTLLIHCYKK